MQGDRRDHVVHIVEDDAAARGATARFLRAAGYLVYTYENAIEFLRASPTRTAGCVVLDLQLPGPSGFDIQEALAQADDPLPVVFLSGHGGVADSVRAMKRGAVDFLTKSADGSELLDAVSRALARNDQERTERQHLGELRTRYGQLSPREREVMAHVISGQLNKQVGFDLGVSEQTIKIHRHRVFKKMRADSVVHLVHMATELGIAPVGNVR
jgi:FixJ family two-component response regulator